MWCWFRYRALEVRSMFFFQQARAKEKRRMVRGSSGSWPSTAQWTPVVCGCDNMASLKILKPNHGSLFTIRNQFYMYYIYIAHVYWPILAIITFTNHHEQIRPTLNPTNHLVLRPGRSTLESCTQGPWRRQWSGDDPARDWGDWLPNLPKMRMV